ncbi:MAG: hypothetical protein Q4A82_05655 [Corynebacterium sp.]|nr:hypothetical protein [Corynebacterium sp.]
MLDILTTTTVPEGDVHYYFSGLSGEFPGALMEYPVVGTWPAHVVFWFSHYDANHYLAMFEGFCMVLDGLFFALLLRSTVAKSRSSHIIGAAFWAMFAACTGHVAVQRLDIFPAVIVGAAALCLFHYPKISAVLVGFATMIKLWPGVLAVGLVRGYRQKVTYWWIAAFVGTIAGVAVVVGLFSGVGRLLSPFEYQNVRGLQIESVAATSLMLRGAFGDSGVYTVDYASSKSYEIYGPNVQGAIVMTDGLMLLTLVLAVAWAVRGFVKNTWSADGTVTVWIALIFMLIVANKVFSPQYLLWVGPILAVALLRTERSKFPVILAGLTLGMAVLGQAMYPFFYTDLIDLGMGRTVGVVVLAVRNGLMIVAMVVSLLWVFDSQLSKRARQSS